MIPVNSSTKERIHRVAAQLGYQPNLLARALHSRQTRLLGCLFADMNDPFLHPIAQAAQRTAREHGYRLLSADAAEQSQELLAGSEMFDRTLVDGMLILGAMPLDEAPDAVEQALQNYPCIVAFGRGSGDQPVSVGVDNELGTRLLLNHLYSLGHRRIAYLGCQRKPDMRVRRATFTTFLHEHDLACPEAYVRDEPTLDFADGYRALRAGAEIGVRVPEELSLGGFNGLDVAVFTQPPLTTVRQPIEQIGQLAVQLLIEIVEGSVDPMQTPQVLLTPELLVRASTDPYGERDAMTSPV